jgi:membrane protease YdiL (CAAX protease family)
VSTMLATLDERGAPPLTFSAPARDRSAGLHPWGFWASLVWGLCGVATALFASVVYATLWMLTHELSVPYPADAAFAHVIGIVGLVAPIVVLVIAVKSRNSSLRNYFALNWAPRRDLVLGTACLLALIAAFEAMEILFGFDGGTKSVSSTYQAAKLAGALPALWLSVVIVAPVAEELVFRGFLHRGWSTSRLGTLGTIILTSVIWAALHQQYSWVGIVYIFIIGLIFGWMRQRSGSTTLTIGLHALNNLIATVLVAVQIEWLS